MEELDQVVSQIEFLAAGEVAGLDMDRLKAEAKDLALRCKTAYLPAPEVVVALNVAEDTGAEVFAFDPTKPAWTPLWWPRRADGARTSPAQRAAWFLESWREMAKPFSDGTEQHEPPSSRILRAICELHEHVREYEEYVVPEWLA